MPWKFTNNGLVDLIFGNMRSIKEGGEYWASGGEIDSSLASRLDIGSGNLYPASHGNRHYGMSVCKEQLKPMHGETVPTCITVSWIHRPVTRFQAIYLINIVSTETASIFAASIATTKTFNHITRSNSYFNITIRA